MNRPETPVPDRFDAEQAWEAVARRDASLDGHFVMAVRTTGIYCRPSCPARRPLRRNVDFFRTTELARAAGYRACLRCHPDAPASTRDPIAAARTHLMAEVGERLNLEHLAKRVGLSPFHLQRRFKERYGLSPREFAAANRGAKLKSSLRGTGAVTRAIYDAGFGSGSRVYENADSSLGMTPGQYARGGLGMAIRYTLVGSPFGRLLVGVTDRGVAAVSLGSDDLALERGLRAEFPRAEIERVDAGADSWLGGLVDDVARSLEGRGDANRVPLDLVGTAFQYRVWRALLEIPSGSTRSYRQVAKSIGQPRATRAVARAIASNRVAYLVPCHRVIHEDGTVGGYRWGIPTKRSLLEREARATPA